MAVIQVVEDLSFATDRKKSIVTMFSDDTKDHKLFIKKASDT